MSPPFPVVQTISSPSLTQSRGRRIVAAMNLSHDGTRLATLALYGPQSLRGHLRKLVPELRKQMRLYELHKPGHCCHRNPYAVVALIPVEGGHDSPLRPHRYKK